MSYRRRFTPPTETREYRKLYVIAVEGDRTETQYFKFFGNDLDGVVAKIEIIPPKTKSAPQYVLESLQEYFDNPGVEGMTELWMVIDRDGWHLDDIVEQCREKRVNLCVSNPAFEFWLLLHFHRWKEIEPVEVNSDSVMECKRRLRENRYLPGFVKKLNVNHWEVLKARLENAIRNAKELDTPPCKDYPRQRTGSTVYRLVEKLKLGLRLAAGAE